MSFRVCIPTTTTTRIAKTYSANLEIIICLRIHC